MNQGRLQVSGKGGAGEGLAGDCGLVFPGADPGFHVIGGIEKVFGGILCEKSRDQPKKSESVGQTLTQLPWK